MARHRVLLIALVLSWGISWPAIKIGVATVPPIWFACFRYGIATVCLFVLVIVRDETVRPPRSDWPLIAVSGVLQMAVYSALTAIALTVVPPGRASVLAFSTPVWVVPLAAWWLRERTSRTALLGVGLGVSGVLAIAGPAVHSGGARLLLAHVVLVASAASWAVSIVIVRAHRFTATTLALAPWQTLVAACLLVPLASLIEGPPPRIGLSGAASLAYVGPVATAFAYWAVVESGRHFRAASMSMALLAAPGIGILISALVLHEHVGAPLIAGVFLIGAGIRLATKTTEASAPANDATVERSGGLAAACRPSAAGKSSV
jgi:drug/metabolite transporter (DMT)-like permease